MHALPVSVPRAGYGFDSHKLVYNQRRLEKVNYPGFYVAAATSEIKRCFCQQSLVKSFTVVLSFFILGNPIYEKRVVGRVWLLS